MSLSDCLDSTLPQTPVIICKAFAKKVPRPGIETQIPIPNPQPYRIRPPIPPRIANPPRIAIPPAYPRPPNPPEYPTRGA